MKIISLKISTGPAEIVKHFNTDGARLMIMITVVYVISIT